MASKYQHQDVATVPSGWKVRTVASGSHKIRVAFPPGRRQKGSGKLVSILHPRGENPMCGAMRNPAELVLMGANPTRRELQRGARERSERIRGARLNPMFNANFTEDEKMALGRLGIKWSAIQSKADVRRARKALKTMAQARRQFGNPHAAASGDMPISEQRERAAEIYSGFHAAPPENKIVLDEPHIPAGAYPELGLLISVGFKPTPKAQQPYEQNFVTEKENVHVIGNLDRDQIYFAGGDQKMSEKDLRFFGWQGENQFHLGTAVRIVYLARKYHEAVPASGRGELVEWVHDLGEETGEKPMLWYDAQHQRIFFKHGAYEIRDEGIVN